MTPPLENVLHRNVVGILRRYLRPEWKYTHIPNGEFRNIRTAVRLKAMGVERGWPDLIFLDPDGRARFIELKREGAKLTDDQKVFQSWCIAHGAPYIVADAIAQVITALLLWDCLIVREL